MVGGLSYANDLTEWLKYEPKDPDHNLAASWHSYNFNHCNKLLCWTSQVGLVIDKVRPNGPWCFRPDPARLTRPWAGCHHASLA